MVSELRRPADDRAGRPSGGRGAAVGAGAPVGADRAASAALSAGVESRAELRGAAGVHARPAQRVRARRSRARRAGGPHGQRHRAAARGRGVEREPALSHPRAGRGVHRSARGRAGVSSGAGAERRRGGGGAGHDPPPGAAVAGAPPLSRRPTGSACRSRWRTSSTHARWAQQERATPPRRAETSGV